MSWTRRVTVVLAVAATLAASPAVASAADQIPLPPIGPECRPNIVNSVLASLVQNGVPLTPGQKIQYLQITQGQDGVYRPELCTVTVPR